MLLRLLTRYKWNLILRRWRHFQARSSHFSLRGRFKLNEAAFFIVDEYWASQVAQAARLLDVKSNVVLEVNPGNGPLSECLLSNSQNRILSWEHRSCFWTHLQLLNDKHPGIFTFHKLPFVRETVLDLTHSIDERVVVIGSIESMEAYILKLILQLPDKHGPWKFDSIEFYFIVNGTEYRLMTEADQLWRTTTHFRTALYELFFDIQLSLVIPLSAFNINIVSSLYKQLTCDKDNMYLMRLTLKNKHSFEQSVCRHSTNELLRLLRLANRTKASRVIPFFEHWCPDIGLQLINYGITMAYQFRDIPLMMYPDIYKVIIANKHYSLSPLKHLLEIDVTR